MNKKLKTILTAIIIMYISGCATNRAVLDINNNESVNPAQGQAIKFVRITDNRDFQIKPSEANIPSLKNNEINDSNITSRAIARKRNGYGKALGDILLPENKTVMNVVENLLAKGFRDSGYRVLSVGDDNYNTAIPVEVDIAKFWGWFSPGFWSIGLNFQTLIKVTAPINEFQQGIEFDSDVQKRFQTARESNWKTVIDLSLDELNKDIQKEIQNNQK